MTAKLLGQQAAFPIPLWITPNGEVVTRGTAPLPGMSLRTWLAGMAMQGMCGNADFLRDTVSAIRSHDLPETWIDSVALSALRQADALLEALASGTERTVADGTS